MEQTDHDKKLMDDNLTLKNKFLTEMVRFRELNEKDLTNDYYFIQYMASILNFAEYHNDGCLTKVGMQCLELDVNPINDKIKVAMENKTDLPQKDLVRFCLYILNSYATSILIMGLFELAQTETIYKDSFPEAIVKDFEKSNDRVVSLVPKFKDLLDTYSNLLKDKYRTIFNEEKVNGFVKPIFNKTIEGIQVGNSRPNDVVDAKEMKSTF
jgi:hypothetical protein